MSLALNEWHGTWPTVPTLMVFKRGRKSLVLYFLSTTSKIDELFKFKRALIDETSVSCSFLSVCYSNGTFKCLLSTGTKKVPSFCVWDDSHTKTAETCWVSRRTWHHLLCSRYRCRYNSFLRFLKSAKFLSLIIFDNSSRKSDLYPLLCVVLYNVWRKFSHLYVNYLH